MLAERDGSGGNVPGGATLPRPLIGLCDPSLCRATTAKAALSETGRDYIATSLIGFTVLKAFTPS